MPQVLVQLSRTRVLQFEGQKYADGVSVADVLERVEDVEGIPADQLRLSYSSKCLKEEATAVPLAPAVLKVSIRQALCGGKGGFGAMLRAAGRIGGKSTTNFGACRDLNGRRLRHVNDEIKLQKWYEANEEKKRRRKNGDKANDDDEIEEKTKTGIAHWHLDVPGWVEGNFNSKLSRKDRTKLAMKRSIEDEEDLAYAEGARIEHRVGKVTAVDNVNKGFAIVDGNVYVPFNTNEGDDDWAETLMVGDKLDLQVFEKKIIKGGQEGRNKWRAVRSRKVGGYQPPNPSKFWDTYKYNDTEDMGSKVRMGMQKERLAKRRKVEKDATELAALLPVDLQGKRSGMRWSNGVGWLGLMAGDVQMQDDGTVYGVGDFSTTTVLGCSLAGGKFYYEVELLTGGVMQIGWADHLFKADAENGDGVGDDVHSWAYDGVRQQCWNGEQKDYGKQWKQGDVVGCSIELKEGSSQANMSFSLNGEDMGVAFSKVRLGSSSAGAGQGFFPAVSVEGEESVRINIGQRPFAFAADKSESAAVAVLKSMSSTMQVAIASSVTAVASTDSTASTAAVAPAAPSAPAAAAAPTASPSPAPKPKPKPVAPKELKLGNIASVDQLEKLGLDRLKAALLFLGVKCGGTLQERAKRLFSLKGVPVNKIDRKLLAKK